MIDRILSYSLVIITSVVLASAVGGTIGKSVDNLMTTSATALKDASR